MSYPGGNNGGVSQDDHTNKHLKFSLPESHRDSFALNTDAESIHSIESSSSLSQHTGASYGSSRPMIPAPTGAAPAPSYLGQTAVPPPRGPPPSFNFNTEDHAINSSSENSPAATPHLAGGVRPRVGYNTREDNGLLPTSPTAGPGRFGGVGSLGRGLTTMNRTRKTIKLSPAGNFVVKSRVPEDVLVNASFA
ncbi:hypothetical protein HDU76_011019, partial [Blyttiomyces sp. JEL0837]